MFCQGIIVKIMDTFYFKITKVKIAKYIPCIQGFLTIEVTTRNKVCGFMYYF